MRLHFDKCKSEKLQSKLHLILVWQFDISFEIAFMLLEYKKIEGELNTLFFLFFYYPVFYS